MRCKMRVIAGKAKSLALKTTDGDMTRPTTDRIKETLFNMIAFGLADCHFLDLFSGSGGIGIEALSRGAAHAYFVENNRKAIHCIEENLKFTRLTGQATIVKKDVIAALLHLAKRAGAMDFIFMDPPYNQLLEKKVLTTLSHSTLVDDDTLIIAEADIKTKFDYLEELGFTIVREKRYGNNKHIFIKKSQMENII